MSLTRFLLRLTIYVGMVCVLLPGRAPGQTTIVGSTADFEPRVRTSTQSYDPGPSVSANNLRVGFQSDFSFDSAFFFRLPVLGPGESITGADFSIMELADTAATAVTPIFNADLVALGFTNTDPPANTATESQNYFYLGEGALDMAAGRQQIQNNFLVPTDFIPVGGTPALKSTDATGDSVLHGYITGLYANQGTNGFVPGTSYLILRLNPDIASAGGTNRYRLASADNIDAGVIKPTLTLQTIPEPGSAALFALGAVGVCGRHRRRVRVVGVPPPKEFGAISLSLGK